MARTRAQRRRHTVLITLALVITLIVLVFARDVSRSAHGAITERLSENRSFAALANGLIDQENQFDARLDRLLGPGVALQRTVFAARLYQLNEVLPGWITDADLVREPVLSHHVNETLYELTLERVAAYQSLLGEVARALSLPWSTTPLEHVANPSTTIVNTSTRWNAARFSLSKEPGQVKLTATTSRSGTYFHLRGTSDLVASRSLALVRAISIVAMRVTPAPLPASRGVLLLPPVTTVDLGVSVLNASYDDQPVIISIRVTPTNNRGQPFLERMRATLGPLQAYAFVPSAVTTAASERAEVVITVAGARAAVGKVTTEHYRLEMSPSGNS
ncbi:MAG TPA: hypothetical protein VG246_01550 [Acidimicrobiales bacterium]|nr:hypothetical protein [Acidimicrobiales bacterium]